MSKYPCGRRVEPDILISIHDLSPDSCPDLQNTENLLDVEDYYVCGSRDITTTCRMLYFHATV